MLQRILTGADVEACLEPGECIEAVERVFRAWGEGRVDPPSVLAVHVDGGGFHIKAATLGGDRKLFVAKTNGNFPANPGRRGLPSIQGVMVLCDAEDGTPLAVMDSVRVTALRTAAATAVAARALARPRSERMALVGCGAQAWSHVDALEAVLPLRHVTLFDLDRERAARLAARIASRSELEVAVAGTLSAAVRGVDVCVTCTTSTAPFLEPGMVDPGTFVAAVGADSPHKHEIAPTLMASARVVVDSLEQCAEIGDLRHALSAGVMTSADVHGTLADILVGAVPGRTAEDEVFVFDSTGTALQDVAAAAVILRRAEAAGLGLSIDLRAGGPGAGAV